jgi:cation transport regulator ChaB
VRQFLRGSNRWNVRWVRRGVWSVLHRRLVVHRFNSHCHGYSDCYGYANNGARNEHASPVSWN